MHVDQERTPGADRSDAGGHRLPKRAQGGDGARGLDSLCAGKRGKIGGGSLDGLADPAVRRVPAPCAGNALLVQLVVIIGSVVGDDEQRRDIVARRRPKGVDAEQGIPVAKHAHRQPPLVAQRQGGANGQPRTGTDAAATILAKVIQRATERPKLHPDAGTGEVQSGRGIAYAQRNGAVNALVAEVDVNRRTGVVSVRRFIIASDHGQIVNRKAILTTIEGNLVMSLSRTLFEEVIFDADMVQSEDWATYPILEMDSVPDAIDIHMIDRPEIGPRGAGEASTRIVPGAVANAAFDATGVRIRKMPLTPERVLEHLTDT